MTMTQETKKLARTLAKVTLYGTGGILLGWPLIKTGKSLYEGKAVDWSLNDGVFAASGYSPMTNTWTKGETRNAIIRDVVGGIAIYAGRKV